MGGTTTGTDSITAKSALGTEAMVVPLSPGRWSSSEVYREFADRLSGARWEFTENLLGVHRKIVRSLSGICWKVIGSSSKVE
ncbi:hypothetical protein B296_00008400 [Ensete ventricosum]|uniref:Uncharacterized protein n=1 Tax=Ensete ventricosum TaxID=4639 RepID=A0A427A0H8_ENSVE|nr:hypothetical protein B296_00008400 [Ensete ventricosum]